MRKDQIDRPLAESSLPRAASISPVWPGLLLATVTAVGNPAAGQVMDNVPIITGGVPEPAVSSLSQSAVQEANIVHIPIRGRVVERETGEPIPFCSIINKEANKRALTDMEGNFVLPLPLHWASASIELESHSIGYAKVVHQITLDSCQPNLEYSLYLDSASVIFKGEMMLGDVSFGRPNPVKRVWWKIKRLFR
jgi:hypothetical protein